MLRRFMMASALLVLMAPAAHAGHFGKLTWKTGDPEKNMEQAKSLGQASVLFFTADW